MFARVPRIPLIPRIPRIRNIQRTRTTSQARTGSHVLRYIPEHPADTTTAMISSIDTNTRIASGVLYSATGQPQEFEGISLSRVALNMRKAAGLQNGKFVSAIPGLECSVFTRFLKNSTYDPLGDNVSSVTQVPTIQDDLTITNAARVSFHKEADWFSCIHSKKRSDEGLLNYLIKHDHWTPVAQVNFLVGKTMPKDTYIEYVGMARDHQMSHLILKTTGDTVHFLERGSAFAYFSTGLVPKGVMDLLPHTTNAVQSKTGSCITTDHSAVLLNDTFLGDSDHYRALVANNAYRNTAKLFTVSLRIKMPISVARQYFKSGIGFVVNEVSRRYVRDPPEVYIPKEYREYTEDKKQGSKDTLVEHNDIAYAVTRHITDSSVIAYSTLLDSYAVCPEQARGVLPQNMYTEFVQTGTIDAYIRMLRLRLAGDAQWEIRMYAKAILQVLRESEHRAFFEDFPCQ